jgi:adenylate cyclase class 2
MQFEVEQKHRIDIDSGWDLAIRLAAVGGKLGTPIDQEDQYFAHPCRDFARTDEALRLRLTYGRPFVTYKGPKLDKKTKTRREIEFPLKSISADQFEEFLVALGFSKVAVVTKQRRPFQIDYGGRQVDGAYDIVGGLGVFVELELMADEAGLEEAKRIVAELARKLDLGPSIASSYLEMLLEKDA